MSFESANRLPAIDLNERLIHGTLLKCVDGRWFANDTKEEVPAETKLLALLTARAVQHWQSKSPVQTIIEEPGGNDCDLKELNGGIPKSEWEPDLNGELAPPWRRQFAVYLLSLDDAAIYTSLNGTLGQRIAWEKLRERVGWMRALRSASVFPLVQLGTHPLRTKKGAKMRPDFKIVEWRELGGAPQAVA